VNAIKWDPQGNLLASCSDDMTLKVSIYLSVVLMLLIATDTDQISACSITIYDPLA